MKYFIESNGESRPVSREDFIAHLRRLNRFLNRAYSPVQRALDTRTFNKRFFTSREVRPVVNRLIKANQLSYVGLNDLRMLIESLSRA